MHLKAVIFDADHTLYTPAAERAYEKKFEFLAKESGKPADALRKEWEDRVENARGSEDPGQWERKQLIEDTLHAVGAPLDERVIEEAYSVFWDVVAADLDVSKEIPRLLNDLKQQGIKLAVATDEFPEPLRIKLHTALRTDDITEYFDKVVTPYDTGTRKPSKAFYEPILDAFDVLVDETVMVGDSWVRDLHPAQEMGMTTVLVDAPDRDVTPKGAPDYTVEDVMEVEDILTTLQEA